MAGIKFTKNELKKQKDALARFQRYLPTLQLKKQQLQMEIRKIDTAIDELRGNYDRGEQIMAGWAELFCADIDFGSLLHIKSLNVETGNVAGIDIPLFKSIEFEEEEYDLFATPLWVDKALELLKEQVALFARIHLLEIQRELISNELRITSQRVNLFEKVKIVEAKENIRVIRIYLGDQQTAAVVRGKISKKKIAGGV